MPINFIDFGVFGETLVVLVTIVVPAALVAVIAYWVIRMAVRDGVLDARRRCGEVVPGEDPDLVLVSSRGRKALYLAGAVLLILGIFPWSASLSSLPTPRFSRSMPPGSPRAIAPSFCSQSLRVALDAQSSME